MKELCGGKKGLNMKQTANGTFLLTVQRLASQMQLFLWGVPEVFPSTSRLLISQLICRQANPSIKQKSVCMDPVHILSNACSHLSVTQDPSNAASDVQLSHRTS